MSGRLGSVFVLLGVICSSLNELTAAVPNLGGKTLKAGVGNLRSRIVTARPGNFRAAAVTTRHA
jgi:hypothetical protein